MRTLSSFLGGLGAFWFPFFPTWGCVEAGREGPLSDGVGVGVADSDMVLARLMKVWVKLGVDARVSLRTQRLSKNINEGSLPSVGLEGSLPIYVVLRYC